nr:Chain B, Fibroblast growth factor receptor 2 [synthetic construct]
TTNEEYLDLSQPLEQ